MGYQNLNKKELIREVRYLSDKLKKSQNLLESILKNEIDADEVCSDKTEQLVAKVNEEHLAAKKKAENSDQLKTAFISNISHEIRTPINSILGYSKILMESASDEQQKNHINVISKSGRYLLQLINDIIDISRIEADELKVMSAAVSVNDLMYNLKKQFYLNSSNSQMNNVEFRLNLPLENNDQPIVYTDEFRVKQVLSHLLSNSFKFTKKGYVELGYEIADRKELIFFVRDTGAGISTEDRKIIFDRFQQGQNPSEQVLSGTGLGLAISKGLAKLLGGEIWLESEKGRGSAFYFKVPFTESEMEISGASGNKYNEVGGIPKLTGKNILIAEDDFYCREILKYMLKKTGATLLIAKDGREALNIMDMDNVDLVLLDIRLPGIDGHAVLKEIRSDNPQTPVIAQTAYAMQEDIRKFKDAGFNDYLTKPIDDGVLYNLLRKYLS
jgi:signal transduction histidine kinase